MAKLTPKRIVSYHQNDRVDNEMQYLTLDGDENEWNEYSKVYLIPL
ncbi:MAG: hypothetical protein WBH69_08560 [Fervidobacterium sp.]